MIVGEGANVSGWPLKIATVPSAARRSTVTGTIGARKVVVWPDSGGVPTIVYGQTDCGLPKKSKPGSVNWSDQLVSESTPGSPVVALTVILVPLGKYLTR